MSSDDELKQIQLELEIHKKLLNIFQVGDFYYYVFNLQKLEFDLISHEIEQVLGYDPKYLTVAEFLTRIHPEDHPWFLNFERKVAEFFSKLSPGQIPFYKVRYDYRIKRSDGSYIRILQQVVTIDYDEQGRVLRTFGVHTDISHLKMEGKPILSFIGLNGQATYVDVSVEDKLAGIGPGLTSREREILTLLASGLPSKAVAEELCISKETVSTHRRNLLAKTNSKNTAALLGKAIREGWI